VEKDSWLSKIDLAIREYQLVIECSERSDSILRLHFVICVFQLHCCLWPYGLTLRKLDLGRCESSMVF
jgi:hypothetical protein